MLRIECQGCHTSAYADCTCTAYGHVPAATGVHLLACPMTDLGAAVACPPSSDCCDGSSHAGLSHDAAANACPRDHGDAVCPEPKTCRVWASETADTRHPAYTGEAPGNCPGGHCHKDVPGCTVCRPVLIEVMPGSTNIQTAVG